MNNTNCYFGLPPQRHSRTGFPSINKESDKSCLPLALGMLIPVSGVLLPALFKLSMVPRLHSETRMTDKVMIATEDRSVVGILVWCLSLTIVSLELSALPGISLKTDSDFCFSFTTGSSSPHYGNWHISAHHHYLKELSAHALLVFMTFAPSRLETS